MKHGKPSLLLLALMNIPLLFRAPNAETLMPISPLPLAVPEDNLKSRLGERLFHERRLSAQGQRSCATCHPLDRGAMDGRVRAEPADGVSVLRNTPTVFNVAFNFFYNWDGAVTTLEAHLEKVLLNPKVMNATWPTLLNTLRADSNYARAFADAYPDGLTKANLIDAFTRFERGLITPNARFDRFLRGEHNALDTGEKQGYRLFNSLGCVTCHQGVNIGGNLFQKFGVFRTGKEALKTGDEGRYAVTQSNRDRGVYRVPGLRNVAVTAPYFHDGRAATLEEAVDTMARDQLGKPLTARERSLIVKFLNTLTGEYLGRPVAGNTTEAR